MNDLDLVSRSLARVRGELSPSGADKARLRAAIFVSPTLPMANAGAVAPAPLSRWVAVRMTGKLGLAFGSLLLGGGVAIGFWWGNEPGARAPGDLPSLPASASSVPVEPSNVPVEPSSARASGSLPAADRQDLAANPADPSAAAPAQIPKLQARAHAESAARAQTKSAESRKASVDLGLEHELALLRRVERAIRANDPALALALLAELDAGFPDTRLAEERLAARCIAECRAGKPDAQRNARRFILEHGSSVYRQRIGVACEVADPMQGGLEHGRAPMKKHENPDTHVR